MTDAPDDEPQLETWEDLSEPTVAASSCEVTAVWQVQTEHLWDPDDVTGRSRSRYAVEICAGPYQVQIRPGPDHLPVDLAVGITRGRERYRARVDAVLRCLDLEPGSDLEQHLWAHWRALVDRHAFVTGAKQPAIEPLVFAKRAEPAGRTAGRRRRRRNR